jgi:CRISPR-associated protein Cmr3
MEKGKAGPKAVRYAVPSGSVYFFEVVGAPATAAHAEGLWLQSIAPNVQDQRDGFGLAIPGIW